MARGRTAPPGSGDGSTCDRAARPRAYNARADEARSVADKVRDQFKKRAALDVDRVIPDDNTASQLRAQAHQTHYPMLLGMNPRGTDFPSVLREQERIRCTAI
jgi:hypothetical protein